MCAQTHGTLQMNELLGDRCATSRARRVVGRRLAVTTQMQLSRDRQDSNSRRWVDRREDQA
eukprot:9879862-Alexandrium_andersonii.AAC.1